MTQPPSQNRIGWRLDDLDARLKKLEGFDLQLVAYELKQVHDDLRGLRKALYGAVAAFSAAVLAIVLEQIFL